jgi:hypothetical protein
LSFLNKSQYLEEGVSVVAGHHRIIPFCVIPYSFSLFIVSGNFLFIGSCKVRIFTCLKWLTFLIIWQQIIVLRLRNFVYQVIHTRRFPVCVAQTWKMLWHAWNYIVVTHYDYLLVLLLLTLQLILAAKTKRFFITQKKTFPIENSLCSSAIFVDSTLLFRFLNDFFFIFSVCGGWMVAVLWVTYQRKYSPPSLV